MSEILRVFDRVTLADICAMPEESFADTFDLDWFDIPGRRYPDNYYLHRDNGASVLAVAHLDTVAPADTRSARYVETEAGTVVYSRALDDRLGAYIALDLLPRLGVTCDWLLTVGEECGQSTAEAFTTTKSYDWLIEFDRGGSDVVMYQYDDAPTRDLVIASGAKVGEGIFSDICYMDSLGVKGFNWGVGYRDYHGPRAHAYLDDTFSMVESYLRFHDMNAGTHLPHSPAARDASSSWFGSYSFADEYSDCPQCDGLECVAQEYCLQCGWCLDCDMDARDCLCYIRPESSQA